MKMIAPDYYPQFRCIADKCRHSCCIGWEIDIDPDTREKYRHVPGAFGKRLNGSIDDSTEVSCFRIGENERCPMLNASGLCDLITELGEENLCQICADHPRFRSFFTDRTELGLGLCCEEAARIILCREEPLRLITLADDGAEEALPEDEAALLALRAELIALMQDRSRPIEDRLDALLDAVDFAIPEKDWAAVYRGLERLDPVWDNMLDFIPSFDVASAPRGLSSIQHRPSFSLSVNSPLGRHSGRCPLDPFGNFTVYLLYRHLPGALEDDDIAGRVAFCVLSTRVLMALCAAKPDCTMADLLDFARMYSAEIEYSEDNIAALLDALWEDS